MHRHALRDDQWERIKDYLPGRPGSVGVTAANNRWTERLRRKGRWGVDAERLGVFFEWAGLDLRARYSKDGRPP